MRPAKSNRPARRPDRKATAQAAFEPLAAPLIAEAIDCAAMLEAGTEAEALHRLRVAMRRLRSLWWAYRPLFDGERQTRHNALYRYLATVAGQTRDWDVLIGLVARASGTEGELPVALRDARAQALTTSRTTLANADLKAMLRDTLNEAKHDLAAHRQRPGLRKLAIARVDAAERRLRKRIKQALRADPADYAAFHEVRKAGKKLRYLLEFFAPVLRRRHRRMLEPLGRLQKRFGKLNDVVASENLLREHADELGGVGEEEVRQLLERLEGERAHRLHAAARLLRKSR